MTVLKTAARLLLCLAALAAFPSLSPAASRVPALLAAMSLEEKVGQVFMVWIEGATVSEDTAALLRDRCLGGVILYTATGNTQSPGQVAALTAAMQGHASATPRGIGLFVGIDQENGPVARLRQGVTLFPSQMGQAATGKPALARAAAAVTGKELKAVGVNFDFAPVADVNVNPKNPVIGIRSFGSRPARVARFTAAATAGFGDAGVACTPKHFPGHGDTAVDSHLGLPVVTHDAARLARVDFPPFLAAFKAGAPAVMTAHVAAPALTHDPALPSTLSARVLDGTLRRRLGFTGLIVTDSLGMGAVANTYGTAEGAVMALRAGADLLLVGADKGRPSSERAEAMDRVLAAVRLGEVPLKRLNQAVARVLAVKERFGLLDAKAIPPPAKDAADKVGTAASARLAEAVARQSLTLFGRSAGILPLPRAGTVVFRPGLGREPADSEALAALASWPGAEVAPLPPDPDPAAVAAAVAKAGHAAAVVVLVTDAGRRPGQAALVAALAGAERKRLVLVAAESPYDLARFPDIPCRLATYGEVPASLGALGRALFAPFTFTGRCPVDLGGLPDAPNAH